MLSAAHGPNSLLGPVRMLSLFNILLPRFALFFAIIRHIFFVLPLDF